MKAIYPGTFDPITVGHLDVIKRAAGIYDHLVIAVMENRNKKCTFSKEERKKLIEKCVADLDNVTVVIGEGLTVNLAREMDCRIIIRGIRAVSDYESELALATANMQLNGNIETVFMVAKPELSFLSSSIAKEIASFKGDITSYIPEAIIKEVSEKLYQ
ncbi:MAG: pantetheine-phosphate adenylyltransferase [Erysipelotrichaceae bacterium]|nr:pantetheine-phosphate adenylyltransferase [Erysipelotrichaceae bacterium]MBQ1533984.1 pantetheine-phosphate adenylyltransferase [Erysipelotrichaceae bacterium]MBQ1787407.1 pantetheine-phosphate adenylyltransferase [Erysipelotrichaceae bacterium]MBQ5804765.1 pantetheine-phosphate adenylyltransferase [Erysipelotrichaceae bacterium]